MHNLVCFPYRLAPYHLLEVKVVGRLASVARYDAIRYAARPPQGDGDAALPSREQGLVALQLQVGMRGTLVQRLTRLGPFAIGSNFTDTLNILFHPCRPLQLPLYGLFIAILIDGRLMIVGQLEQEHGLLRSVASVALSYALQTFDVGFLQYISIGVVLYISQRLHASVVYMSTHCGIGSGLMVAGELL